MKEWWGKYALWWREVLVALLTVSAFFVYFVIANETRAGILVISFLDVSKGSAVFVDGPGGVQVLVDDSGGGGVLGGLGKVIPFYDRSIDVLVAPLRQGSAGQGSSTASGRYDFLYTAKAGLPAQAGERIALGNGATFTLKYTDPSIFEITYGQNKIYFVGRYPTVLAGGQTIYNPNLVGTQQVRMDGRGLLEVRRLENKSKLGNDKVLALLGSATSSLDVRVRQSNCKVRGPFPDPSCTPGAIFGQATVEQICVSGYTKRVRNVSASLKRRVYAEYGISYPQKTGSYEADHLIPLALGGSNDIANLFPEAAEPRPGFREKDVVEVYLYQEVCAGRLPLAPAQIQIASDWLSVYNALTPEEIKALKSRYGSWADN